MSTITAAQRQAILDLEAQVQTLKSVFSVTDLPPPPPPSALTPALLTTTPAVAVAASTGTRKKKVNVAALPTAPVVKKGISSTIQDLNKERMAVYTELKEAWLARHAELADVARVAWAEGATGPQKKALTAAIRAAGIESPPSFADALQEHARRRAAANEGQAAKYAAYRAKVEAQQKAKMEAYKTAAASATTTTTTTPVITELPAKTTPLVINSTPKVVPAPLPAPAPIPAPAPTPQSPNVRVSIVRANNANAEAFKTWEHEGSMYFKNGLGYVYKKTSKGGFGDYVGRYDAASNTIDTSVPEPEPSNTESNMDGGRRKTRRNRKRRV
jgi:hypothetical protein